MECRTKDFFAAYMIATFVTTFMIVPPRFRADFSHSVDAYLYGIVFLVLFVVIAISVAIPCAPDQYIVKTVSGAGCSLSCLEAFLWGGLGSLLIFASLPTAALAGVPEPGFFLAYRSALLFSGPVFAAAGATGAMVFWFIVTRLRQKNRPTQSLTYFLMTHIRTFIDFQAKME